MNSHIENIFLFTAAYIFLVSYYAQYKFILNYHPRVGIENFKRCNNVEILEAQINGLLKDLGNKYAFWSFQLSIVMVGFLFLFTFPEKSFYFVGALVLIVSIQAISEYFLFSFPLALKAEVEGKTAKEVLKEKETIKKYNKVDLSDEKEGYFKNIAKLSFDMETESLLEYLTKELCENDVFPKGSKILSLEDSGEKISVMLIAENEYSKKEKHEFLVELTKDEFSVEKVSYTDSNYVSSFYEDMTFNRLFLVGLLEPILATFVFFVAIKL